MWASQFYSQLLSEFVFEYYADIATIFLCVCVVLCQTSWTGYLNQNSLFIYRVLKKICVFSQNTHLFEYYANTVPITQCLRGIVSIFRHSFLTPNKKNWIIQTLCQYCGNIIQAVCVALCQFSETGFWSQTENLIYS